VIPGSRGEEDHQLYTDGRFHHLGIPFNREIPGVAKGEKVGVAAHAPTTTVLDVTAPPSNPPVTFTAPTPPGFFKTSTLRNVAKGAGDPDALTPSKGFTKAYTHNGYFKSLRQIVHFYNTRDALPVCTGFPNSDQATAAEAIAHKCWPRPEFDSASVFGAGNAPGDGLGNLGLDDAEENDIVAYLETLSDDTTPQPPTATKSQK
jgi:cytochrome c peroxidase